MDNKRLTRRSGFTLIELMIAMGVFVLIIGIVVNIFVTSLQRQRSAVALMAANDNASIAIEQMAREVRTGKSFTAPVPGTLRFTNAKGETIEYRYNATPPAPAPSRIERSVNGAAPLPLTGNNVKITDLRFSIVNLGPSWPPRILMNIQVGFTDRFLRTVTNDLQTTVSVRDI